VTVQDDGRTGRPEEFAGAGRRERLPGRLGPPDVRDRPGVHPGGAESVDRAFAGPFGVAGQDEQSPLVGGLGVATESGSGVHRLDCRGSGMSLSVAPARQGVVVGPGRPTPPPRVTGAVENPTLRRSDVEGVDPLARVGEGKPGVDDVDFLEPVERVPDCPGR